MKMSKYKGNPVLLSDLKVVSKNKEEMTVSGANRNLKLSEYYGLGSHSQF
jgi:hypothetical protein